MAKKFNIHDWHAKIRLNEQFTPDLEDDDLKRGAIQQMMNKEKKPSFDPSKWLNYDDMFEDLVPWIESVKPGMGGAQIRQLGRDLKDLSLEYIDYKNPDFDKPAFSDVDEVEVTGMEPDTGNMEKEYNVIGPKSISEPLKDVTIEYNGQPYIVSFEYGDIINDRNETDGKDVWYEATAEDGTYFMVDVYEDIDSVVKDVFWDTLEIEPAEGLDFNTGDRPIDEQNAVAANTGFSIEPGNSMTYATKNAFGKKRKKRR